MTEFFSFKKGMKVEVSLEEEGFRGAWFTATIINPPTVKNNYKVLIQYDELVSNNVSKKPLKEKVDFVQIRPVPPRESSSSVVFKLDDDVDAFYNDGWWEGVVTHVDSVSGKYSVYFRSSREQCDFDGGDLRLHREWDNTKWVPPLNEETQPTDEKIVIEEVNPFSVGTQVEVSNDEEGFEGAWFGASVIEVLEKDKFLIEYKDLLADDNKNLIREEVDSSHIRPYPPKAENISKFKEYEEVDALYNDGWWVGIISKVLARSKYKVFFKSTDEEMEFKHDKLRLHQDWVNGKWVVASQALNLSH